MNAVSHRLAHLGVAHPEQEVRYWMRSPAITINLAAPLSEALALMREHQIRRLPVLSDTGELCGMITIGDIRGADVLRIAGVDLLDIAQALKQIAVSLVMSSQIISVQLDTNLREAALLMMENKIGGLPVLDEEGAVVGVVTESDLFEALVYYLERDESHP